MNSEHQSKMGDSGEKKRRALKDYIGLPGKPHEPIRVALLVVMLVVTTGFFGGALLKAWTGEPNLFLPLFLMCVCILVAHDAYGNRLLPPPNGLAQLTGYLQAVWCFALGAILLWKYLSS
jgi:hypothetical protein